MLILWRDRARQSPYTTPGERWARTEPDGLEGVQWMARYRSTGPPGPLHRATGSEIAQDWPRVGQSQRTSPRSGHLKDRLTHLGAQKAARNRPQIWSTSLGSADVGRFRLISDKFGAKLYPDVGTSARTRPNSAGVFQHWPNHIRVGPN